MKAWEDARIVRGMRAQLELRRQRLASGDRPLGWKVGFAAPAFQERLKITAPLVGFLTRERAHPIGRESIVRRLVEARRRAGGRGAYRPRRDGRRRPRDRRDRDRRHLAGHRDRRFFDAARGSGADPRRQHLSASRGARRRRPARAGSASDGLTCRIIRRGAEFARTSNPQANTGEWIDIVRHVADVLAGFGERLRGGEIIITGSVVPPLAIEPDEDGIAFELDPVGGVSVRFR